MNRICMKFGLGINLAIKAKQDYKIDAFQNSRWLPEAIIKMMEYY